MVFSLQIAGVVLPGFIRLGGLRLPVYGLFAAAGLIAALWLSQRTAKLAGLSANKLWDAGVFAVVAAFVASRLLLVVFDLKAFMRFPLLVLALPSLTYGGMVLTGVIVWFWLRLKRLPVLDVLDAWAPCGALLAAVLSGAHFVEGTDAGMPTGLPWGVVTPGDTVLGRVHPVEIYSAVVAIVLCGWLLRVLARRRFAGQVVSLGMMVGGGLAFVLDMVRQPVEAQGEALLDPGQFVALAAMMGGALIYVQTWKTEPGLSRIRVAQLLEDFAEGREDPEGWNQYEVITYERFTDPLLMEIQKRFPGLSNEFPADPQRGGYCNEKGFQVMLDYARQLRHDGEQSTKELI